MRQAGRDPASASVASNQSEAARIAAPRRSSSAARVAEADSSAGRLEWFIGLILSVPRRQTIP